MKLLAPTPTAALRPTAEQAAAAWADRVSADRQQVERLREVDDPADFYVAHAQRFAQDLVPDLLDFTDLREEAMAPDVEAIVLVPTRSREPSDDIILLQNDGRNSEPAELVCGGETGRSRPDDDAAFRTSVSIGGHAGTIL